MGSHELDGCLEAAGCVTVVRQEKHGIVRTVFSQSQRNNRSLENEEEVTIRL